MPHIESEYNNLVIDSRNMEQALKLFKDKYEEAMFVIEWEMDINKTLGNYLSPLLKHEIIHSKEADGYQQIICNIGMIYCQAVNVVCDVFNIERPWNKNRADVNKIASSQVAEMASAIQNEAEELQEPQSANGTSEQIVPKTIKRELPSEFAEYFNAPFKGIGPNNINYYDRLEDSLTDPAKKRSTIEYAKIALFIYQSKKILPRKKPNTFSEWYQYFCKIVGCKYNYCCPLKLKRAKNLIRNADKQALRFLFSKSKPPYPKRVGSSGGGESASTILSQSFSGCSKNV